LAPKLSLEKRAPKAIAKKGPLIVEHKSRLF